MDCIFNGLFDVTFGCRFKMYKKKSVAYRHGFKLILINIPTRALFRIGIHNYIWLSIQDAQQFSCAKTQVKLNIDKYSYAGVIPAWVFSLAIDMTCPPNCESVRLRFTDVISFVFI